MCSKSLFACLQHLQDLQMKTQTQRLCKARKRCSFAVFMTIHFLY